MKLISRITKTGTLISQTANVWLFNGNPDESISARCYRQGVLDKDNAWHKGKDVIDFITYPLQANHCYQAWNTDLKHATELVNKY